MTKSFTIKMVEGSTAPRYDHGELELCIEEVVITEQGTEKGLPIVDVLMIGPNGERYLFVTTGRMINMISAAVKGANKRNHGMEEP